MELWEAPLTDWVTSKPTSYHFYSSQVMLTNEVICLIPSAIEALVVART